MNSTIKPIEVEGWSKNITRTCEQSNIVEYTGQIFGIFSQDITLNKKIYSNLPPHWSALVRVDLMLYGSVDQDEGDYVGIQIENNSQDRFTKFDHQGYQICSKSKTFWGDPFNDEIYPYQKNITHKTNSLLLQFNSKFTGNIGSSDYEGYGFKHLQIFVDTCFESCSSCTGPTSK